jgi:S1-C subfamily serine protease
LAKDHLITNNHVFAGHLGAVRVGLRRDDMPSGQFRFFSPWEFAAKLVTGSDENSYDYAVLKIPEIVQTADHQFSLEGPGNRRIGDPIALLGFPLEHDNLACHQGIISSFYHSGLVKVIQIDASVNAGNSGGPLIDPDTGVAFGIVTRKATGLTGLFDQLRNSINANIALVKGSGVAMQVGPIDFNQAIIASQNQMLMTLTEIERQANVGIGYAFSAEHLMAEPCMKNL